MTSSPTVVTSRLLCCYTELWARGDFLIEFLHLFCQILYYFYQRLFTITRVSPLRYFTSDPGAALSCTALTENCSSSFMTLLLSRFVDLPYTEESTCWYHRTLFMAISVVHGLSTQKDSPASLSNKPSQNHDTACFLVYRSGKVLKALTASHNVRPVF